MTLREEILDFFKKDSRPADFLILADCIPSWGKGDWVISSPNYSNLIYWGGLSEETTKTIKGMLEGGEIYFRRTSLINYIIGGAPLKLPIAKHIHSFQKPHWLPVAVCPGPKPTPPGRRNAKQDVHVVKQELKAAAT
jgi:hypothetical protein